MGQLKQPIFETYAGALDDLLFPPAGQPRGFVRCDLYTFNLATGDTLRYATGDVDVGYSGDTWAAGGLRVDTDQAKAVAHWKRGLDVDTWQVTVYPRSFHDLTGAAFPDKIGNQSWLAAARAGALDGAIVDIDRAYRRQWPAMIQGPVEPTAVLPLQGGRVAEVDVYDTAAVININSHLELMNAQMPRNLFQLGCIHTLFDAGCTLIQTAFEATATAAAGSTQSVINSSLGNPAGSGTYALGQILFTSGANAGFRMMITGWAAGVMTLRAPLPFPVAVGDAFKAYPGCDKTQNTCKLFGNLINFGGTPYVPAPETAV